MCISVNCQRWTLFIWFWIFLFWKLPCGSVVKSQWKSLTIFLLSYPFLSVCRPSDILDRSPLLVLSCKYLFFPSRLCGIEIPSLMKSTLLIFSFIISFFLICGGGGEGVLFKKSIFLPKSYESILLYYLLGFIVLILTFIIHLE